MKIEIATINETITGIGTEISGIQLGVESIGLTMNESEKQVKDQHEKSTKNNECMFIALNH